LNRSLYAHGMLLVGTLLAVVTILMTGWVAYDRDQELMAKQRSNLNNLTKLQASAVSDALWNLNRDTVREILNGTSINPDFHSARVITQNGQVFAETLGAQTPAAELLTSTAEITVSDGQNIRSLGRIELTISLKRLIEKQNEALMDALEIGLIQLLAVLLGIGLVLRRIVRPLDLIKDRVITLTEGQTDIDIPAVNRNDQIGDMARGVRTFRDSLIENKLIEIELKNSENRFRSIFDTAQAGISIADDKGQYQQCNKAWAAMLGYTQEEIFALTNEQVTHPEDRKASREKLQKLMSGEIEFYRQEKRYVRKDGSEFWGDLTVNPVKNETSDVIASMGVCIDITERKKTHQHLLDLSAAIDAMSVPVVVFDNEDKFIFTNEAYRQLNNQVVETIQLGEVFESHIRAIVEKGLAPEANGREEEWIAERMARHRSPSGPFELKRQDGTWFFGIEKKLPSGGQVLLLTDISAIKKAQNELVNAKVVAEDANRAKSDFLSSMSHELRTPMNAILGFAQLLEYTRQEPLSKNQKSSVNHIIKGGNHLLELIDQVLELSTIEAGKLSLNIDHIPARNIIDESLDLIRTRAEKDDIKIVDRTANEDLPLLWADSTRLTQVLINLLSNAVKYNRKGGSVILTCRGMPGEMLRISVADTGRGIPAEKQNNLFKPFERLGRETGEIEGTGIGLTITKQIIELMGGQIGYESEEAKGSTFWIEIPISRKQADVETNDNAAARPNQRSERKYNDRPAHTVLYVEDNPANMQLMETIILQVENTILLAAHNAELGIDLARSERPDLILMDINLPGMNGIEALKQLQNTTETKNTPVIAITADAMPKDVEAGKNAGFSGYITKPINVPQLIRLIEETLQT